MNSRQQFIIGEVKDYVFITLGLLLYTSAFTIFLMPYEIVTGGVTGMSAIIFYATGFKIEYTYMIINLSLLIMALIVLGFRFMIPVHLSRRKDFLNEVFLSQAIRSVVFSILWTSGPTHIIIRVRVLGLHFITLRTALCHAVAGNQTKSDCK